MKGRLCREDFWLGFILVTPGFFAIFEVAQEPLMWLVVALVVYMEIAIGVKRSHDLDQSGGRIWAWNASLHLFFYKGDPKPNKYGTRRYF